MFEEHEYYTAEDQRLEQTYYNTEKGIYISQIQTVNKLHHYVSDNDEKYRYEYEQSKKWKNQCYITTLHKFQENLAQRTVKEKGPHEPHTYNEEGEEFIDKTPWVHLDIAGTDVSDKEKGYLVKGATGVPVRTLVNLVLSLAK